MEFKIQYCEFCDKMGYWNVLEKWAGECPLCHRQTAHLVIVEMPEQPVEHEPVY